MPLMDHHFLSVQEVPAQESVADNGEPHGVDPILAAFVLFTVFVFIVSMVYIYTH